VEVSSLTEKIPYFDEKDTQELSEDEQVQLKKITMDYYKAIEGKHVSGNLINYEHEIRLQDNIPVTCKPRLLPTKKASMSKSISFSRKVY
jgi:hypothetical protein